MNQLVEEHQKKILEVTIEDEKQRMTQAMLNLSRKGDFAKELIVRLKEIDGIDDKSISSIKMYISNEMQSDDSLLEMDTYIAQLDKSFFSKLKLQFPQLTDSDIKLCALIRMNLSNKQLGIVKNITSDSVKRSKTRLGKKMNLPSEMKLSDFIKNI